MKHISFSLSDKKEYKKAVKKSIAKSHRSQLIQIFTSQTNKRKIKILLQKINKDFPSALVIGTQLLVRYLMLRCTITQLLSV